MLTTLNARHWGRLALLTGALLTIPATAGAQGPPIFYYPTVGTYMTTAGPVLIPAPGYYYNVPAQYAQPATLTASARYWTPGPTAPPVYRTPGSSGGMGTTPYFQAGGSGATPHYLHGRGYDTASHR